MKIFLIISLPGGKNEIDHKSIANILEARGNKITTYIIDESAASSKDTPEKTYQKNINSIKKADFIVAEATHSTAALGFLTATALSEKKPVLALFDQSKSNSAPSVLAGYAAKNKLLAVRGYSKDNLPTVFDEFFGEVRKILDTKFILIISPEIDSYLQWASDNRRMHKAQVVRRAVEKVMNDDKEYKKFVNAQKRK